MFDPERIEIMIMLLIMLGGTLVVLSVWFYSLMFKMAEYKATQTNCWKYLDVVKEQSVESMDRLRELTKKLDQ